VFNVINVSLNTEVAFILPSQPARVRVSVFPKVFPR